MATTIRAEISDKNKYYIDKHRHYELKHFCLQYPSWKKAYADFDDTSISLSTIESVPTSNLPGDPTAKRATTKTPSEILFSPMKTAATAQFTPKRAK